MKRKKTLSAVPMGLFFDFPQLRKVRKMKKCFFRANVIRANGMGILRLRSADEWRVESGEWKVESFSEA